MMTFRIACKHCSIFLSTLLLFIVFPPLQAQTKTKDPRKTKLFRLWNPDTLAKPTAGYSQIAEVTGGKTIYIAGQVSVDREGKLLGEGDFKAQVKQVFENLKAALTASGADFNDVIKLNYYCAESVEPSMLPAMREIRDSYINIKNPPTSALLVVKRLARPEWMIEIEAVAVTKE